MKFGINEKKELCFGVDGKECSACASIAVTLDGDAAETFMQIDKSEEGKGNYYLSYTNKTKSITAETEIQTFSKINAFRQKTHIVCNDAHTLTQIASANIGGVCFDENGLQQRLSDGSILIHYCISR